MKINFNKAWVISKINFRHLKLTYIITAVLVLAGCSNLIQYRIVPTQGAYIDMANYLYAAVVLAAIFIPALNFRKIMHLNGKKIDFYWGALINYAILSAVVSFADIILFLISKAIFGSRFPVVNLVEIFGWLSHGVAAAFFQQFFFLLFTAVFIHTLTTMQTFWFGWVTDVLLIAIISVFIPIPPLRAALVWFFYMIIFNGNALVQILSCLILSAAIYSLDLLVLHRKKI
ncbi:MAG: hypothetical protein ACERKO_02960 [Acetanaerobacterium sp.]